jgi:hypothetical protein
MGNQEVDCSLLISEVKLAPALVLASNYTSQEIESLSRMSAPVPNAELRHHQAACICARNKKPMVAALVHGRVRLMHRKVRSC